MLCGKPSTAPRAALALLVLPILAGSTAQLPDYYSIEPPSSAAIQMEDALKNISNRHRMTCNSNDDFRYKEECQRLVSSENSQGSKIDKIKNVELEPTQIVITTTKEGPVNTLKIHIELVDLHDNRTMPRIDLFGLFLVVTRGRYTVPFLKPSRWYGLTFVSENLINGETNVHKETRLLRTASRERTGTGADDMYEVFMHRNLDGEESVERVYVTSKWSGEERVPGGELHVFVKILCESSSTSEQMILHSEEDSVTIEISMDLRYDINHLDDSFHRVVAHITPLKCHKVCWQSSLISHVRSTAFSSDSVPECHDIEPTTSVTFLREMKEYAVEKRGSGYELVVETELHDETEDALITISVLNLAENNTKTRSSTFSADSSNGTFHMPLSSDTVYAVQYEYVKMKPFHFTKKEHFLVEVAPVNDSEPVFPLVEVNFNTMNSTANNGDHILTPFVIFTRSKLYANRDVHLHLDPLCEDMQASTWTLTNQKTSHRVNLTPAICTSSLLAHYCHQRTYTNSTNCSQEMCYSTSVVVDGDEYASDVRCLNVTHQFPPVSVNISKISIFLHLLTALLLSVCISTT